MSQIWALVAHDLSRRMRSLLIWGIVLGALGALYVALYPSMSGMLDDYLQNAPESMRQYMGEFQGSITAEQWMEMEFTGSIIPIALPFLVMLIAARAVAGSEERKTLDLLLSNPLQRRHLIAGAALTMALALAGVLVVAWVLTYIAVPIAGVELGAGSLARGLVVLWPYCLFFGALALFLSALMRRGALATTIAAVVLVAMYIIDGLTLPGRLADLPLGPADAGRLSLDGSARHAGRRSRLRRGGHGRVRTQGYLHVASDSR
jgi:ABC-2 type transport system permease protein